MHRKSAFQDNILTQYLKNKDTRTLFHLCLGLVQTHELATLLHGKYLSYLSINDERVVVVVAFMQSKPSVMRGYQVVYCEL